MNKFKKLLVLILTLIVLVSAFTVVALATEADTGTEEITKDVFEFMNYTFEGDEVGTKYEANANGVGYYGVRQSPYGDKNKYLLYYLEPQLATANASYVNLSSTSTMKKYKMVDYNYMMLDFDIMMPNEDYSLFSYYVLVWSDHKSGTQRPYSFVWNLDALESHLPQNPYEWAHGSIILEYVPTDENNGTINGYAYINGTCVETWENIKSVSSGTLNDAEYTPANLYFGEIRLNNGTTKSNTEENSSAYDNMTLSYFKGYTLDEVANYHYSDWVAPYGMTYATVNGAEYDDVSAAIAAATSGETIKIVNDVPDPVSIKDKNLVFDINKYDENGDPTGEYYSVSFETQGFVQRNTAGIVTFEDATFEVTTKAGAVTYHTADEFATLFSTAESGSTIKLLKDLFTQATQISVTKDITLDLNGYDITRFHSWEVSFRYGTASAAKNYGTDYDTVISGETAPAGYANAFYLSTTNADFTITSSREGSDFYHVLKRKATWLDESDAVVKTQESYPGAFVHIYGSSVSLLIENISVYATSFVKDDHATLKGLNINIDNCNLYKMANEMGSTSYPAFYFATKDANGGTVNISNTFLYDNVGSYLIRQDGGTTVGNGLKVTFTNCDFYTAKKGHNQLKHGSAMQVYENCRYWGAYFNSTYAGTFQHGSLFTTRDTSDYDKIVAALPEGLAIKAVNETRSYTYPTTISFIFDENGLPVFPLPTTTADVTYNYRVILASTVAMIGDTEYSDINEALAAAKDGETIVLCKDISDTANITNVNVAIDTNIYSAGAASGTYYTINYTLPSRYAATTTDGIITFDVDRTLPVTVIWAPGTAMNATSEVTHGNIPEYPNGSTVASDGIIYNILGWSYTEGGDAADLLAITDADILSGTVTLYPVYETQTAAFTVTTSSGEVTYHTADEFETVIENATSAITITLIRDLDTNAGTIAVPAKSITIDLNGFDIRRTMLYGNTYLYNSGTAEDEIIKTATSEDAFFSIKKDGAKLTITSSGAGSEIYVVNMKRDSWVGKGARALPKLSFTTKSFLPFFTPVSTRTT